MLEEQRPGSAIVFLQSGDVEGAQAELRKRGGEPSEIEKVNWIKMRMFEVRDPDGNVLWFGQSYHEQPDSPSRRKLQPHGMRQDYLSTVSQRRWPTIATSSDFESTINRTIWA